MAKQVLSIEQMKKLSKLMPLKENTDFIWWGKGEGTDPDKYKWELHCSDTADANPQCDWIYPAYTLQDILNILPSFINEYILLIDMMGNIRYDNLSRRNNPVLHATYFNDEENTLIDAAYEMLCWCIENYPEIIKSIKQ